METGVWPEWVRSCRTPYIPPKSTASSLSTSRAGQATPHMPAQDTQSQSASPIPMSPLTSVAADLSSPTKGRTESLR
ncbi:hypothetical protein BKA81DRAFT_351050 [Phyllosticta paracitricarpa]